MLTTNDASSRARWAVMWIAVNGSKRRLIRKDFGDDYAGAHKLYLKAHDAGKPFHTLACVNMGFPPPKELRPHEKRMRGRDKHTRKIRTITVTVEPLKDLNHEGKLWCPYCREIRPFTLKRGFEVDGIPVHEFGFHCPICKISHRDYHVRKWNPTAVMHMDGIVAGTPRARKTPTRRRRRR